MSQTTYEHEIFEQQTIPVWRHQCGRGNDLLSAGLGLPGLLAPLPTPTLDTDAESLRRRAIHHNWNGIACPEIAGLLDGIPELELQEAHKQSTFKLSYYVALDVDEEAQV